MDLADTGQTLAEVTFARPAWRWCGAAPWPTPRVKGTDATDSFLGQALHMLCRLRDHIDRLDRGAAYAVDDLAVVLRAMLYQGDGNRVLARLHKTVNAAPIEVLVSKPPMTGKEVIFSVGSLPATTEMAQQHGASWMPLQDWVKSPVVALRKGEKVEQYTWSALLNRYANKWGGAHLDTSIPADLRAVDR